MNKRKGVKRIREWLEFVERNKENKKVSRGVLPLKQTRRNAGDKETM